jgi:hypothetical protein
VASDSPAGQNSFVFGCQSGLAKVERDGKEMMMGMLKGSNDTKKKIQQGKSRTVAS